MPYNFEQILDTAIQERLSTELTPCPEGTYDAVIQEVAIDKVSLKNGEDRYILRVTCATSDPEVVKVTNRNPTLVTGDIWLDIKEGFGGLVLDTSKGANVGLGRLREAAGQNEPGKPWKPKDLIGRSVSIQVTHRTLEDGRVFAGITKFGPPFPL